MTSEEKIEHPLFLDYGMHPREQRLREAEAALPKDEDGNIQYSAVYGSLWLVEIEHNTDEWGIEIDVSSPDHPRTLHGPFNTQEEAVVWMDNYPDDDGIFDMEVIVMNKVRP